MPNVKNARLLMKRSNVPGESPTIPATQDHRDGSWRATDLYEGELFINLADDKVFYRSPSGIKEIVTVAVQEQALSGYNRQGEGKTWVPFVDLAGNITWTLEDVDETKPPLNSNITGPSGNDGSPGTVMSFKGEYAVHPPDPQNGWSYRNTTDKKTYIYDNNAWLVMSTPGMDGISGKSADPLEYKGEFLEPPLNPSTNWIYRNTDDNKVYVYSGNTWKLMTQDGDSGIDGIAGENGSSVYISYHNNDKDNKPDIPTGDATSNGWHTDITGDVVWMSQKVANTPLEGSWGAVLRITGFDGTNGADGAPGAQGIPGPTGSPGTQGPGILLIGDWDNLLVNEPTRIMNNSEYQRDVVQYNSNHYAFIGPNLANLNTLDTPSAGSQQWEEFTSFSAVATGMLIADKSYVKETINVGTNADGNSSNILIDGSTAAPYISLGQTTKEFEKDGIFLGKHGADFKMSLVGANSKILVKESETGNAMFDSSNLVMDATNVGRQIAYSTEGYSSIDQVYDTVSKSGEVFLEFPVFFLPGETQMTIMYRGFGKKDGNFHANLAVSIQPIDSKGYGDGHKFMFANFGGTGDEIANPGQIVIPLFTDIWDYMNTMCNIKVEYMRKNAGTGSGIDGAVFVRDVIVMTGRGILKDNANKGKRIETASDAHVDQFTIAADEDMPIVNLFTKNEAEIETLIGSGQDKDKYTLNTGKFSKFVNIARSSAGKLSFQDTADMESFTADMESLKNP